MRVLGTFFSAVLIAAAANGCQSKPPMNSDDSGQLDRIAWMSGSWVSQKGGTISEEHWTRPRGDTMLGTARTIRNGQTSFYEFLRIEATDDGVYYHASPRGRQPTPFRMTNVGPSRVVFENPQHDFPQRITYTRQDKDRLHAKIEGVQRGQPASEQWSFQRIHRQR